MCRARLGRESECDLCEKHGTHNQGYRHKKHPPPRTLQQDYTWGRVVVLGGGGLFLMREVPLSLHSTEGTQNHG